MAISIASLTISIMALLVAFWGGFNSYTKLRLDLYDRRMQIHEAVHKFIDAVGLSLFNRIKCDENKEVYEAETLFRSKIPQALYLFDKREEIIDKMNSIISEYEKINKSKNVDDINSSLKLMRLRAAELGIKTDRYMSFRRVGRSWWRHNH